MRGSKFLNGYKDVNVGYSLRFYDQIDETKHFGIIKDLLGWSIISSGALAETDKTSSLKHLKKALNWGTKIPSLKKILPWFKSFFKSIKKCLDSTMLIDTLFALAQDIYYDINDLFQSNRKRSALTGIAFTALFATLGYFAFIHLFPLGIGLFNVWVQEYIESGLILFGGYLGVSVLFGLLGKTFGDKVSKHQFKDEKKYFFSSKKLSKLKRKFNVDKEFVEKVHFYLQNRIKRTASNNCKIKYKALIGEGLKKARKQGFENLMQFLCYEYILLKMELAEMDKRKIDNTDEIYNMLNTDLNIIVKLLCQSVGLIKGADPFNIDPYLELTIKSLLLEEKYSCNFFTAAELQEKLSTHYDTLELVKTNLNTFYISKNLTTALDKEKAESAKAESAPVLNTFVRLPSMGRV